MTDKVRKIKDWISKEQDGLMDTNGNFEYPEHEGAYHILCNLDAYIDSMQEEPKFNIGDRIKLKGTTAKGDVITNIYKAEDGNTYFEFENSDDALANKDWELVEEPKKCMYTKDHYTEEDRRVLCEDCDEKCECNKKEESVSKELEEACEQLAENARKHKAETSSPFFSQTDYRQGVMDGAKWQREQMMANAVDVAAHIDAGGYPYIPQMELYDYDKDAPLAKEGDKYKVILIKEV